MTLGYKDSKSNSSEFGGIPPYQGIPRILEEFHGFWSNSTDFGGIPRILEEFLVNFS
jgi:hypothetical protein